MAGTALALFLAALVAAVAAHLLDPAAGGAGATRQSYAVAGAVLLALSAVAVLAQWARQRTGARRAPATDRLLDPNNRRSTFRLQYPPGERPGLRLRSGDAAPATGGTLEILDLSEEGVRVGAPSGDLPQEFEGEVHFPGGEVAPVAGRRVWCRDGEAALRFSRPLPARLVVAEQLRLKEHVRARRGTR